MKVFFLFRGGFVGGTARSRERSAWEVIGRDIMARGQKQWKLADKGPSIAGTFGLSLWF